MRVQHEAFGHKKPCCKRATDGALIGSLDTKMIFVKKPVSAQFGESLFRYCYNFNVCKALVRSKMWVRSHSRSARKFALTLNFFKTMRSRSRSKYFERRSILRLF